MEDTSLNFKQALVGQLTDMLMVARLDESGNAIGGGYYSVADLVALINTIQVEDNLTTTNLTSALSANQGRILKELIDGKISSTLLGVAEGVATLGVDGKVPSAQLPSFVDDVVEYASLSAFPVTGEGSKIYVALDTNKTYRWSGTQYVLISGSLALGEVTGTAYDGAKGKANADNITTLADRQNVLLDNKVVNGDFTDGAGSLATNFSGYASVITSWISGVQSFTATANNSGLKYNNKIPVSLNDSISVIAKIKKNVAHTATDIIQVGVLLYDAGGSIIGTSLGDCNLTNDYNYCSTKVKIVNINATHVVPFVYKPSSADVTDISVTEIFYFNVSDIFGIDKEPSAELIQKFIENIGYFEDAHTMTNLEIMNAYNNYIEELETTKADIVQEDWINPTFLNGATGNAKYYKDNFRVVRFAGIIQTASLTANDIIRLPAGYITGTIASFVVYSTNSLDTNCRVYLGTDGSVTLTGYTVGATIYLSSISYLAEK